MVSSQRSETPGYRRFLPAIILMVTDAIAICAALLISFMLRFEGNQLNSQLQQYFIPVNYTSLIITLVAIIATFNLFRLYRYAWRFASLDMLGSIVLANVIGTFELFLIQAIFTHPTYPRSIYFIFAVISIVFIGAERIFLRLMNIWQAKNFSLITSLISSSGQKRVVILGGGSEGARLLNALREDIHIPYRIIGFLDDLPHRKGLYIRGVRVLGPLNNLYKLLEEELIDEVFIVLSNTNSPQIRDLVMACRRRKVPVMIIPAITDVLNRKVKARLEEISVEDLLRRPPVQTNMKSIGNFINNKRVLITGAGGSIGSEICRQIISNNPSQIILLGHGENSIHLIYHELIHNYPAMANRISQVICSVTDTVRVNQVFRQFKPQIVYHAAAHKHVPIMEANVVEAVHNNVFGTDNIATACGRYEVEAMLLISTDKAVNPTSIMGATKWLCEEVLRSLSVVYPKTQFITVRFGNVLGSRGSVIPLFREQIRRGGPVTVTHPEMTRYFMTIPEAVQLVLQASAIGNSGELFLLDMGQPVKIIDLARDMIKLSGFEPDIDIAIVFTGLRPGEKIFEELTYSDAVVETAACDRLFIVRRKQFFSPLELRSIINDFADLVEGGDNRGVISTLERVVPAFINRYEMQNTYKLKPNEIDNVESPLN
ncbi:MAG: nucleoside-diphosphate sugar epimerase/dehydratase [bacterium]